MIKGLAITPPVLGRISIGRVVEKKGQRLPEKDDQFTITTQIQNREGWIHHPLDAELRSNSDHKKLRSIPVRLLFNEPDLNFRVEYSLFDRKNGRPVCVGNGETCKRQAPSGVESLPCPSPTYCELASKGGCKPYGRLNVIIGDEGELGTFIFRTTGFNSIRSLSARLHYFQAVSGDLLACLPLELRLRGKSTTQSHRTAVYYVDLTIREGTTLEEAITEARGTQLRRLKNGYQQKALDKAAAKGFCNSAFEDDSEDIPEIIEEFYPDAVSTTATTTPVTAINAPDTSPLEEKLERKISAG